MYRQVDTTLWGDPWYQELSPTAKFLYLYLKTNGRTTACGAYQISCKTIAFETGLAEDEVPAILAALPTEIVRYWPNEGHVFLVGMFSEASRKRSGPFFAGAVKQAALLPITVRSAVYARYPELNEEGLEVLPDSLPIASPMPQKPLERLSVVQSSTEQKQDRTEQIAQPPTASAATPPVLAAFNRFYTAYPEVRRTDREAAWFTWRQKHDAGELDDIETVLAGLTAHIGSGNWQEQGGRFIPKPMKFLNDETWRKKPMAGTPTPIKRPLTQAEMNAPAPGRFVQ